MVRDLYVWFMCESQIPLGVWPELRMTKANLDLRSLASFSKVMGNNCNFFLIIRNLNHTSYLSYLFLSTDAYRVPI